jgi:hypothetical protein
MGTVKKRLERSQAAGVDAAKSRKLRSFGGSGRPERRKRRAAGADPRRRQGAVGQSAKAQGDIDALLDQIGEPPRGACQAARVRDFGEHRHRF